ncbi:putative DNA repair and transcription factor Ada [Aspergillus saccharolyticus JOP 1030-1]|uniref:HTH araC/xylS-type domain-containing protein n=1 Tax=Aspergillus saccharolyticus JOP 1030-1 TaxID=1450539 RepID=A0A318ZEM0_9EURO|nr:hypothetical protein BP01DRAFT_418304 [Aspergillus saccharolyticus JOP 1030-1]PYH42050.1 hypothetical protein BP01DRAFT_418304 [Aspergillus saccharolyticus JOP 1030-1]
MDPKPQPVQLPRQPLPSPSLASASARWQAVVKRDPTATAFVYAVLTTKIYCRASCPGRLARRANVRFYDLPSQAQKAGFRACKRCRPESLQSDGCSPSAQVQLVQRACQTISSTVQLGSKPTLRILAAEAGLTSSHFHRVFKKVMGVTPGQYVVEMTQAVGDGGGTVPRTARGGLEINEISHSAAGKGVEEELVPPWNDFDALIAAEAGFVSMQEVQPLDELHAWHGIDPLHPAAADIR